MGFQREGNDDVRMAYAFGIARLGGSSFLDSLVLPLGGGGRRGERASELLLELGPGIAPDLYPYLNDPDPGVRGAVAELLAALGDAAAVPRLQPLLADPDSRVVDRANRAIRRLSRDGAPRRRRSLRAHRHERRPAPDRCCTTCSPAASTTWPARRRSTPRPRLSRRLSAEVLLKREDLQPVFSFKLRGAYNRIAHMSGAERARGVIAASAGNHAQGVAFSARHLGLRAVIVMPKTTPEIKVEAVRSMGAEVVLAGDSYSEAKAHCDCARGRDRPRLRPPLRRPAGDRRPGHDRRGDPAPVPRADRRRLRPGRRGRADRRHGRLPEGGDAGSQGHRRRAVRGRRHVPLARGGEAGPPRPGRHLRRRGRGARGGGADVPHRAASASTGSCG